MPSTGRPTHDGIDYIDNVITQYDSLGLLHEESGVIFTTVVGWFSAPQLSVGDRPTLVCGKMLNISDH